MKNELKLFGIIAIITVIIFLLPACDHGNSTTACTHDWNWTENAIAATCTEASKDTAICKNTGCDASNVRAGSIAALGHKGSTDALAATCTTDGNSGSGICIRSGCGFTVTATVIPALGHEGLIPAFAATCEAAGNGSESGICTRPDCGQIFPGAVIFALGHQGLTPGSRATCMTPGIGESGTCTRPGCGQIVTGEEIPPLGHKGTNGFIAPTCTTEGSSGTGKCTREGCELPPNFSIPFPQIFNPLGHLGLEYVAATCTNTGYSELGTCARQGCGQFVSDVIPALGHYIKDELYSITPTCTTNGRTGSGACTRPGCDFILTSTVIPALGHDWNPTSETISEGVNGKICHNNCGFILDIVFQYKIGDTGPAGGKIFSVAKGEGSGLSGFTVYGYTGAQGSFDTYRAFYLEAAPTNEGSAQWGAYGTAISTSTGRGYGRKNTQNIVNYLATTGETGRAAQLCAEKSLNGFEDWFLPSLDELLTLYAYRELLNLPYYHMTYWSSTQFNPYEAWVKQHFGVGNDSTAFEAIEYSTSYNSIVHAIRAF